MTKLFCVLAVLAVNLPAQLLFRTTIPGASRIVAASGPNGDIWIAASDRVTRFDPAGRSLFTTPLEAKFGIITLAVDSTGRAALTIDDTLILLDPQGRIVRTQNVGAFPTAIAIDAQGNIFLAGVARDGFIGPPGVYKPSFGEKACGGGRTDYYFCEDAYLAKYLPDGTRAWATLFGGSFNDYANAIALDPSGAIWIAGETTSRNMPVTANALQPVYGGGETLGPISYGDAFLARIDATGARLEYATFLGGSRTDTATTLTATATGVVVAGRTDSPNFTTTQDAYRRSLVNPKLDMPGLHSDVFVAFVSTAGDLAYATLFGSEGGDRVSAAARSGNEVAVAVAGNSSHCLLRLEVREIVGKFTPDCFHDGYYAPSALLSVRGEWFAVSGTKTGFPIPGVAPATHVAVVKYDAASNPVVVGVWNEFNPRYRPTVATDSFVTIYSANLTNARVQLGGSDLKVIYSSGNQLNAYIPRDLATGLLDLTINSGPPTPVDVVERWPGLAGAVLNQDGTVNSAANPAGRGAIISLFGSGFGPDPLPVAYLYIDRGFPAPGEDLAVLFAGRVAEGLFQFNIRDRKSVV